MSALIDGEPWPENWADDPDYLPRAWDLFTRWQAGETITVSPEPQP